MTNIKKMYLHDEPDIEWDQERGTVDKVIGPQEMTLYDTDGTNLAEVMAVEDVDFTRTLSNSVLEILSVLGIEGCRAALLVEVRNVIQFDNAYVNYRHLAMLVDCMTGADAWGRVRPGGASVCVCVCLCVCVQPEGT